ncbi:pre-peptidase C-terminal domain-containing protein [bacterium]|nr:pre-peptidase C-terminal domain-containing protein [bacterium]
MKKLLILCAFFMPFFVSAANTPVVEDFPNSSRIYRRQFSLTAGKQYKFRTFSSGDSVLYLLNSSNVQVAMNNNCGSDCLSTQNSYDSTLTYTPTTTGTYNLVMRNYFSGQVGVTANIKQYIDGTLGTSVSNAPLGGIKQSIPAWDAYSQTSPIVAWRKLYFYYFNTDKNASGGASAASNVLYLVSNNAIVAYDHDAGAGLTSKITKTTGSCSSGCYIYGGAYNAASEGNARLIVDPYTNLGDLDHDGLSDALESVLGTASIMLNGSARDTDGDGLNDYLETLGNENILLPWDGSSPTQRDVFVEVDYFGRTIGGNFVNFFKDHETYIKNQLTSSFDRYGDIRLHIDVDDYLGEMSDTATLKFATLDEEPATNPNSSAYYLRTKMSTDFTSSRHGIYRWVVAANRHSSVTNGSSGLSLIPGNILIVSLGSWNNNNDGTQEQYTGTTIHELGHAFGLTHNDNGNNNSSGPNSIIHRSVMNYRYQTSGAPLNIYPVPPYIIGDSIWRYSTDKSTNRTDLDWNYSNIVANTGENGCLNSATEANQSPKQKCVNARPNALPICDCTFDEWAILDLASGVNVVEAAFISSGILSENASPNDPFFGLEGHVIALNLEDLMTSGEKYTKMNKFQDDKEKELTADEKFYTKENRKIYNDAYEDYFRKMGYKENEDFFITDDKVFLINNEE